MTTLRPHTKLYSQDARDTLGLAFTRAREAAGYPSRPSFSAACGVGVTSLWKLESGKPVSASVYEAAARALPNWTENTPRDILEGSPAPPTYDGDAPAERADEPVAVVTAASIRLVEEVRKELAKHGLEMTPDMLVAFLQGVDQQLGAERRQAESGITERD